MHTIFPAGRYFFSNNEWFINMRPGDEKHVTHCGFRKIHITKKNEFYIAGPFKSKSSLLRWFNGFISFFGNNRKPTDVFIPDDLILPDSNYVKI